jgi:hypothetical protein
LAIEVLRKWVYEKEGKERGRQICDEVIVKALTKGPERIRPLSREELRMEIDRLKSMSIAMEAKQRNGGRGGKETKEKEALSEVSSISEQSFVNQND